MDLHHERAAPGARDHARAQIHAIGQKRPAHFEHDARAGRRGRARDDGNLTLVGGNRLQEIATVVKRADEDGRAGLQLAGIRGIDETNPMGTRKLERRIRRQHADPDG